MEYESQPWLQSPPKNFDNISGIMDDEDVRIPSLGTRFGDCISYSPEWEPFSPDRSFILPTSPTSKYDNIALNGNEEEVRIHSCYTLVIN